VTFCERRLTLAKAKFGMSWFLVLISLLVSIDQSPAVTFLDVTTFSGADAGEKINNCINALSLVGGGCDARGLLGTQNISADLTISKSNVALYLGSATFTLAPGVQILIAGSGVVLKGRRNTTVVNASAETGSTWPIYITGSNVRLRNFSLIGNRLGGGAASAIVAYRGSHIVVESVQVENAGNSAIVGLGVTDMQVRNCRIINPGLSGIYFGGGSSDGQAIENHVSGDNKKNLAGHAGIVCNGSTGATQYCSFVSNVVEQSGGAGIRADGGIVTGVLIDGNVVNRTGVNLNPVDGEGIPFSANRVKIVSNIVRNTWVEGIKAFGKCTGVVIANNEIANSSQSPWATHAAIQLQLAGAIQRRVRVKNNIALDDQPTPTQNRVLNISDSVGGGSIRGAVIYGNVGQGNIFIDPIDLGPYTRTVRAFNNTEIP